MKKKCLKCNLNEFNIYPNKLCQKCFSNRLEKGLEVKGIDLKITSNKLIENYIIEEKSINQIAKENNLKPFQVRKYFDLYLIPVKSPTNSRKKDINETIFKNLTPDSSYLLGYIFTDGYLALNKTNNTYFLHIYSKYKYQLENVLKILQSKAKIQHRGQKNYSGKIQGEIYWLHIGNQEIIKSLLELGMVSDKNQEIKYPKIPKNLNNHFIRGCFTGSGSVSLDKNTLLSQITIGSLQFLKSIEKKLHEVGLKKRNIYENKQSKKPSYVIRYATKDSEKLYKYLYKGKTIHTVCKRQEKLYKEKFKTTLI